MGLDMELEIDMELEMEMELELEMDCGGIIIVSWFHAEDG